jgi:predicted ATPase
MRFKVLKPRGEPEKQPNPTCFLVQDLWNDFNFQTQYHLYFSTPESITYIGAVKILKKGQTPSDGLQITQEFEILSKEFVSIGQSLDYYEHLASLGREQRDGVLRSLRDVVKSPALKPLFENEEGWRTSLFRDQKPDAVREFLLLAGSLLQSDYTSLPSEELKFSFQMSGWDCALDFDFTSGGDPLDVFDPSSSELPERVIAIIGRNGSGKSTLLARLARVAFGSAAQRSRGLFEQLGTISPEGIGFPRIITVSYSAFDSFTLPGIAPQDDGAPDEREQVIVDVRRGEGRYIFCGLRDIATELQSEIQKETPGGDSIDRASRTLLKSIGDLACEFGDTLELIKRHDRERVFGKVFDMLATDPSFAFWKETEELDEWDQLKAETLFVEWSTGQKIVAQIVASLVAHITPRSLVLLDEPEMHLHPPLLATLMHAVRYLLKRYKAFAIVATHSPVVLQESMARHVFIMRRDGEVTKMVPPAIETFGENVGFLTSEVFGLNSQVTDFHRVLDQLIKSRPSLETIEQLFKPYGMSLQARAYVMSRLPKKDRL